MLTVNVTRERRRVTRWQRTVRTAVRLHEMLLRMLNRRLTRIHGATTGGTRISQRDAV